MKSAYALLPLTAALGAMSSLNAATTIIDTVLVGDAGNPSDSTTGYGSVSYDYYIGTYEVTNGQYTAFLNAVASTDTHTLYNTNMAGTLGGITRSGSSGSFTYTATRPNAPVNYVSFWDAARFTNWLTTGTTETGVYNLGGVTNPTNNTITRNATAWANGGVAIASENEWYKAAYYSGSPTGADGDGYWLYPTQSNSITTADANYANSVGNVTDVGTYSADSSHYGTFDQAGNLWEWSDEIVFTSSRGTRGGSFAVPDSSLQSSYPAYNTASWEGYFVGFRVTSLEPILIYSPGDLVDMGNPYPAGQEPAEGTIVDYDFTGEAPYITFFALANKPYAVQSSIDLSSGSWVNKKFAYPSIKSTYRFYLLTTIEESPFYRIKY